MLRPHISFGCIFAQRSYCSNQKLVSMHIWACKHYFKIDWNKMWTSPLIFYFHPGWFELSLAYIFMFFMFSYFFLSFFDVSDCGLLSWVYFCDLQYVSNACLWTKIQNPSPTFLQACGIGTFWPLPPLIYCHVIADMCWRTNVNIYELLP